MDSPVIIPRAAVGATVFLRSRIPARHPSAAVLGEERLGTGVAVGPQRILTAHYLVLGATKIEAVAADGKPRPVRRVTLDHESGLALIAVEGADLRPTPLAPDADVAPGQPVFLLACTSAHERKGATGHVSAVAPFEAFWEYMLDRAIMTTAINPGLAGAPLFDGEGRLVGIVSLGLAAVGRYSLAIPVELYVRHREEFETEAGPDRPQRAWVGFYPQAYDGGVVISGVVPGAPADKAGITRGDLVLSVDGTPVSNLRDLYREMWKKGPGESLGFQVLRESAIHIVEVVAGNRREFYK